MRKILYWTMERAILALFTLLLCAPPTLARSGKVIKPQAPPGLQRGTRSLNLTPLARHRQTQARMRPPAATHLRAHLMAGKVAALRQHPGAEWELWKDGKSDTPIFMQLRSGKRAAKRLAAVAGETLVLDFIEANAGLFRLRDPRSELVPTETQIDASGDEHVRLEHYYKGVPIWGSQLVGHLDHTGLYALNGRYNPTPDYITRIEPTTTSGEAIQRALTDLAQHQRIESLGRVARQLLGYDGPRAYLYLWNRQPGTRVKLVWQVEIRSSVRQRWRYFIDAHSGDILNRYQASPTDGPAVGGGPDLLERSRPLHTFEEDGLFYLIDGTRPTFDPEDYDLNDPEGVLWTLDAQSTDMEEVAYVVSSDNSFTDPAAVSAHANMALVYDYFSTVHGRLGIAGDGGTMISVVHVTDGGEPMENAYWNGVLMAYGDGGESIGSLAAALDVAAHEMTHGIIEKTVNLEYLFQSGALNESFADIFGAMVDSDDWLLGEDIVNSEYYPSGAMRDLQNPHNGDEPDGWNWQPAHMDEYRDLEEDEDNGGVHINSGIPNRAAYLLSEAIGRDKAARIYYRILNASYLTPRSQFVDCRLAAERAARDLFGDDSPELQAVQDAYDTVGIVTPDEPDEPDEPLATGDQANQWIATVAAELDGDNSLWLVKPALEPDQLWQYIVQLTTTQVFAETGNAVTAPLYGDFLFFIDSDNNLRYIGLDGTEEEVINDEGDWGSIALSPDGTKMAATTVFEDSTIYYFDLDDPENNSAVKLRHWTTQDGITQDITRFADALQWDATGSFIIYDAYNSLPGPNGRSIDFWEVNVLDPVDESGWSVFPAQPEGIHIANPSLSSRVLADGSIDDCRLIYERIDEKNEEMQIRVLDACTGEEGELYTIAAPVFTFPHFLNNDREIVFEEWVDEDGVPTANLWRLKLDEGSLHAVGDPHFFVPNSQSPYSFIVESDAVVLPTAVMEEAGPAVPQTFALRQNFPNPFNSGTVIRFALPVSGAVDLSVYNLAGQQVAMLVEGVRQTGSYSINWDGRDESGRALASGIYLYQLRTEVGQKEVRKLLLLR